MACICQLKQSVVAVMLLMLITILVCHIQVSKRCHIFDLSTCKYRQQLPKRGRRSQCTYARRHFRPCQAACGHRWASIRFQKLKLKLLLTKCSQTTCSFPIATTTPRCSSRWCSKGSPAVAHRNMGASICLTPVKQWTNPSDTCYLKYCQ